MAYYPPTDWELKDFYREHVDALYCACCFLTCGQGDAQKMTEEIFLSLLNKGMIFSSDKDARAWMLLKAFKMSRKPPKTAPAEVSDSDAVVVPPDAAENIATEVSGEDLSESGETLAEQDISVDNDEPVAAGEKASLPEDKEPAVSTSLFPEEFRRLSRKDRLIALMYYCDSFRKAEIASYLGWPTFCVSNRLKRIKKRILSEKGAAEAC